MEDCLFCKILKGDIPSKEVYSDEHCYAFTDIDPKAPTHILVIPRLHVDSIHNCDEPSLYGYLFNAVKKIVEEQKLLETGYRLVINSGDEGGQLVPHLHVHILAGRNLQWPPG